MQCRCGASLGPGGGCARTDRSGRCRGQAHSLQGLGRSSAVSAPVSLLLFWGASLRSRARWQFEGCWPSRCPTSGSSQVPVPTSSAPGPPHGLDSHVTSIARPPPGPGAEHPWHRPAQPARTQGRGGSSVCLAQHPPAAPRTVDEAAAAKTPSHVCVTLTLPPRLGRPVRDPLGVQASPAGTGGAAPAAGRTGACGGRT